MTPAGSRAQSRSLLPSRLSPGYIRLLLSHSRSRANQEQAQAKNRLRPVFVHSHNQSLSEVGASLQRGSLRSKVLVCSLDFSTTLEEPSSSTHRYHSWRRGQH